MSKPGVITEEERELLRRFARQDEGLTETDFNRIESVLQRFPDSRTPAPVHRSKPELLVPPTTPPVPLLGDSPEFAERQADEFQRAQDEAYNIGFTVQGEPKSAVDILATGGISEYLPAPEQGGVGGIVSSLLPQSGKHVRTAEKELALQEAGTQRFFPAQEQSDIAKNMQQQARSVASSFDEGIQEYVMRMLAVPTSGISGIAEGVGSAVGVQGARRMDKAIAERIAEGGGFVEGGADLAETIGKTGVDVPFFGGDLSRWMGGTVGLVGELLTPGLPFKKAGQEFVGTIATATGKAERVAPRSVAVQSRRAGIDKGTAIAEGVKASVDEIVPVFKVLEAAKKGGFDEVKTVLGQDIARRIKGQRLGDDIRATAVDNAIRDAMESGWFNKIPKNVRSRLENLTGSDIDAAIVQYIMREIEPLTTKKEAAKIAKAVSKNKNKPIDEMPVIGMLGDGREEPGFKFREIRKEMEKGRFEDNAEIIKIANENILREYFWGQLEGMNIPQYTQISPNTWIPTSKVPELQNRIKRSVALDDVTIKDGMVQVSEGTRNVLGLTSDSVSVDAYRFAVAAFIDRASQSVIGVQTTDGIRRLLKSATPDASDKARKILTPRELRLGEAVDSAAESMKNMFGMKSDDPLGDMFSKRVMAQIDTISEEFAGRVRRARAELNRTEGAQRGPIAAWTKATFSAWQTSADDITTASKNMVGDVLRVLLGATDDSIVMVRSVKGISETVGSSGVRPEAASRIVDKLLDNKHIQQIAKTISIHVSGNEFNDALFELQKLHGAVIEMTGGAAIPIENFREMLAVTYALRRKVDIIDKGTMDVMRSYVDVEHLIDSFTSRLDNLGRMTGLQHQFREAMKWTINKMMQNPEKSLDDIIYTFVESGPMIKKLGPHYHSSTVEYVNKEHREMMVPFVQGSHELIKRAVDPMNIEQSQAFWKVVSEVLSGRTKQQSLSVADAINVHNTVSGGRMIASHQLLRTTQDVRTALRKISPEGKPVSYAQLNEIESMIVNGGQGVDDAIQAALEIIPATQSNKYVIGILKDLIDVRKFRTDMSHLMNEPGDALSNMARGFGGYMKSGLLTGILLPNLRFMFMNFASAPFMIWSTIGGPLAAKSLGTFSETQKVMKYMNAGRFMSVNRKNIPAANEVLFVDKFGRPYTVSEVEQLVSSGGILKSQASFELQQDIIREFVSWTKGHWHAAERSTPEWLKTMIDSVRGYKPGVTGGRGMNFWGEIGNLTDVRWRTGVLITALREGRGTDEAVRLARESMFDYGRLSSFEKQYVNRFIWFWTFRRESALNAVKNILENPQRIRAAEASRKFLLTTQGEDAPAETNPIGRSRFYAGLVEDRQLQKRWALYGPEIPLLSATNDMIDMLTDFAIIGAAFTSQTPLGTPEGRTRAEMRDVGVSTISEKLIGQANPIASAVIGTATGKRIAFGEVSDQSGWIDPRLVWYVQESGQWDTFRLMYDVQPTPANKFDGNIGTYNGMQWRINSEWGIKRWDMTLHLLQFAGQQRTLRDWAPLFDAVSTPFDETDTRPKQLQGASWQTLFQGFGVVTPVAMPTLADKQTEITRKRNRQLREQRK